MCRARTISSIILRKCFFSKATSHGIELRNFQRLAICRIGADAVTEVSRDAITAQYVHALPSILGLVFPAESAMFKVESDFPELHSSKTQNAVEIVSIIFAIVDDETNLRADMLLA